MFPIPTDTSKRNETYRLLWADPKDTNLEKSYVSLWANPTGSISKVVYVGLEYLGWAYQTEQKELRSWLNYAVRALNSQGSQAKVDPFFVVLEKQIRKKMPGITNRQVVWLAKEALSSAGKRDELKGCAVLDENKEKEAFSMIDKRWEIDPFWPLLKKTSLVACSSLVFFSSQLQYSLPIALAISSLCSATTIVCEKWLRSSSKESCDWLSTDWSINVRKFAMMTVVITAFFACLSCCGDSAQCAQMEAQNFIALPTWGKVFKRNVLVPVVEEIFFRGFVSERIEDVLDLANRHVYPLNASQWSGVLQAALFGAMHIVGNQVVAVGDQRREEAVFAFTSFMGWLCWLQKQKSGSLLPAMIQHGYGNTLTTVRAFV